MIEAVLYKHLHEKGTELSSYLARWNDKMAIFNQEAPKDTDKGWGEGSQYGRIIFAIDTNDDPERKVSGKLLVDISCEKSQTPPEYLEPIVKELIDGYFFTTPAITMAAQWSGSNYFTEASEKVVGVTLTFDLLAFPAQETTDPDPVKTVNQWLKSLYPEGKVICNDVLEETWKPTDESPAFYCRLVNLGEGRMPSTAAVTWIGADMRVCVMAPTDSFRHLCAKKCVQVLTNESRLILDDGSPMLIDSVSANLAADQMRMGQIQIKATYGVLNEYTGKPLNKAYVNGQHAEREVINGN